MGSVPRGQARVPDFGSGTGLGTSAVIVALGELSTVPGGGSEWV